MALVLEDEWPPVQDLAACPKLAPLALLSLSPRSPLCSPPLSPTQAKCFGGDGCPARWGV